MPFAPDGSKVHEFEHDAGAVKRLDIARVVIVLASSVALATRVGLVDVISNAESIAGCQSTESRRIKMRLLLHDRRFGPQRTQGSWVGLKYCRGNFQPPLYA